MRQFDVYRFKGKAPAGVDLLLILHHDLVDFGRAAVAAPCYNALTYGPRLSILNPVIQIDDDDFVVAVQELAGISERHLGPLAGNVGAMRDDILRALDLLFHGF